MRRTIEKPCVYHYLFSHLPVIRTEGYITDLANGLRSEFNQLYKLEKEYPIESLLAATELDLISSYGNEATQTYLFQFHFNGVLTTELAFSATSDEDPFLFWKKNLDPQLPKAEDFNVFGIMTILFAKGLQDIKTLQEITVNCFGFEAKESVPLAKFEWATLYYLSEVDKYILLIFDEDKLPIGDTFLTTEFPILELIRQHFLWEKLRSRSMKRFNLEAEKKIHDYLIEINQILEVNGADVRLTSVYDLIERFYDNIAKTESILQTHEIKIIDYQRYIQALSLKKDTLFVNFLEDFYLIQKQITYDLNYSKILIPGINKMQELTEMQISLKRQQAEERIAFTSKMGMGFIVLLGVAILMGEILPEIHWLVKLGISIATGIMAFFILKFTEDFSEL